MTKRLPHGSAAGPSGPRFEHVKAALQGGTSCRDRTIEFINKLLSAEAPTMPEMIASRLVALQKHKRGIRPIAVGEVWMRFCSICALALCLEAGLDLASLPLGVSVAGGAQCIGHALRAGAEAHPDHVTVATDVRNACNSMPRSAVLQAVAERYPQLFPFVNWAYTPAAELWVHGGPNGHERLWSTTRVRQGDPMGPMLSLIHI